MKAIFFDIDGTLICKNKPKLTPQLLKSLHILRNRGVHLFISTGRHMSEIEQLGILDQFEFDGYVTMNGGYCTDGKNVIYKENIIQEDVIAIHEYLNQNGLSSLYVEEDDLYANVIDERLILSFEEIHSPLPKVSTIADISQKEIYLFCPFLTPKQIEELMSKTKNCKCTQWFDLGYDIVSKNCSKSVGIQKILEHFHIDMNQTMAFGDGMNDIEMLEIVNIGIAMGNAKEDVKKVADYVTDDVDHDGIIKALQHFGLLERKDYE